MKNVPYWQCPKCHEYLSLKCYTCKCGYHQTHGLPPRAEPKQNHQHEPVAETTPQAHDPKRRLVRLKSFRHVLCDQDNLYVKWFVDALRYAGILHDDSPRWCKIEVEQIQTNNKSQERTEIEISNI